jgi:hypothetical protein
LLKLYSQIRTYKTGSMVIYFHFGMKPVSAPFYQLRFWKYYCNKLQDFKTFFYLQLWFWYVTGGNVWPVFHSLHTRAYFVFIATSRVQSPSYWMGIGSSVRGGRAVGSQLIIYWHLMLKFRMHGYIHILYSLIYIFTARCFKQLFLPNEGNVEFSLFTPCLDACRWRYSSTYT